MSAYRFYIHRAFSVCTDDFINGEFGKIKIIAKENDFYNGLIYSYKFRNYNNQELEEKSIEFCKLKYINNYSEKSKYN